MDEHGVGGSPHHAVVRRRLDPIRLTRIDQEFVRLVRLDDHLAEPVDVELPSRVFFHERDQLILQLTGVVLHRFPVVAERGIQVQHRTVEDLLQDRVGDPGSVAGGGGGDEERIGGQLSAQRGPDDETVGRAGVGGYAPLLCGLEKLVHDALIDPRMEAGEHLQTERRAVEGIEELWHQSELEHGDLAIRVTHRSGDVRVVLHILIEQRGEKVGVVLIRRRWALPHESGHRLEDAVGDRHGSFKGFAHGRLSSPPRPARDTQARAIQKSSVQRLFRPGISSPRESMGCDGSAVQ